MSNTDLRRGLAEIATEVWPVDLYERALQRSAQIRRRRVLTATLAASVAVVAISGTTWQLAGGSAQAPSPPAGSTAPTSSGPTGEPTVTPTLPVDPDPLRSAAVLTVPEWPALSARVACPTGELPFVEGRHDDLASGTVVSLLQTATITVPETHYIGVFQCWASNAATNEPPIAVQVLAYRLGEAGLALVGTVVDPETGSEAGLSLVTAGLDEVSRDSISLHLNGIVGNPPVPIGLYQHRTYTWNGDRYVQSDGPTSFFADIDVSMTVSELVFAPPVEFCRTGTMTLTITNDDDIALDDVWVGLILRGLGDGERAVRECQADPAQYDQAEDYVQARIGPVAPGEARTVTATVLVDTRAVDPTRFAGGGHFADLRVGQQRTGTEVPIVIRY